MGAGRRTEFFYTQVWCCARVVVDATPSPPSPPLEREGQKCTTYSIERSMATSKRTRKKTGNGSKSINLALQGGGAHGAFAWGALDAILDDGRVDIEAVSATSAGAMNAVVLADALTDGNREHARERLSAFWRAIADAGRTYNPVQPLRDWTGRALPIEQSPLYWMFDTMTRVFSPYQLNPFNFNPLRQVLEKHVDFDKLRATSGI